MNFQYKQERSWFTRMWTLMILVFVSGTGSKLWAASDFATTTYNTVIHYPSMSEPYIAVRVLFYDAKDKDSFFTHWKADNVHAGPAVYFDGKYLCSPDWQLAWPGGDSDDGGSGADGYVKDECTDHDKWWGQEYKAKVDDVNYTIKFWNPVCNSDDKRYVDMYIFMDKYFNSVTHYVKIVGRWRTNNANPVATTKEKTYVINGFSMKVGLSVLPTLLLYCCTSYSHFLKILQS